jgi:tetratricopeptide (TPR) repeat protein
VLKHYPKSHVALLNYGNALREKGKYADAVKAYDKIDKNSTLYLKMLENRAYAYYMQKKHQQAINDYQELQKLDSSRNDIKTYIVTLLLENEQLEIAKETALQILKQQPNQSEVWNSLGNYYYHRMQVDSAVAAYTQAINIKPSAMYYYNRANVYSQNNHLTSAIEDYNKAIMLDSLQPDYYLNRAITYYKTKNYLKSLADFNRAISLNPGNKNYYINRATLYVSLNEANFAIADLNKALEIDPNDAEVLIRRSYLYYQTQQKILSCEDAKRAVALGYQKFTDWMNKVCQ